MLAHFVLNMSLLACALVNNNITINKGDHRDFLWYYILGFYLFLNNHGYLIFKKKYKVFRQILPLTDKNTKAARDKTLPDNKTRSIKKVQAKNRKNAK